LTAQGGKDTKGSAVKRKLAGPAGKKTTGNWGKKRTSCPPRKFRGAEAK